MDANDFSNFVPYLGIYSMLALRAYHESTAFVLSGRDDQVSPSPRKGHDVLPHVPQQCCTEGCRRRGGDDQEEANHSVEWFLVQFKFGFNYHPLTVTPGGDLARAIQAAFKISNSCAYLRQRQELKRLHQWCLAQGDLRVLARGAAREP